MLQYIQDQTQKNKSDLYDHIYEAYHMLNAKFQRGLHIIIAGDTNELNLNPILSLSHKMLQVVKQPTRYNPTTGEGSLLDPIITTLAKYYQEPECIDPLDADNSRKGKNSDHQIVVMSPIYSIENKSARENRMIKSRPFTKLGLDKMINWLMEENWICVFSKVSAHEKALNLQNLLLEKYHLFFPEKIQRFTNEDQPWMSSFLKKLDRKRKRVYKKERKSLKWEKINKLFKSKIKEAKQKFYKNFIADLKVKNPAKWYSSLKRICSYEKNKREELVISDISHLTNEEQVELIADKFASIQNQYEPINQDKIKLSVSSAFIFPTFSCNEVWMELIKLNPRKSTIIGDIPPKNLKSVAAYITEPLTDVISTAIKRGEYPSIYKQEIITPIPKVFPCSSVDQLRNISGLFQLDKIIEKLISELIIEDMCKSRDVSQYGNKPKTSIQHYLINLLHRILETTDKNTMKEKFAIIATMIDWNSAFNRQDHTLGVQSFIDNGVRSSLIPLLISYFKDRKMKVNFHGVYYKERNLNSGVHKVQHFGILESIKL